MKTHLSSALATLVLAAAASAQAGGFQVGDVWQSNDSMTVVAPGSALMRIDLLAGVVTGEHSAANQNGFGCLGFDPYRHRLIWRATVDPVTHFQRIWQVDGAGNLTDIGLPTSSYSWFASAGDGRVYCIENTGGPQYPAYIDGANRVHRVLDVAGLVPYQLPACPFTQPRGMVYDPGTNALYACSTADCDGLQHQKIVVGKLPLSADGTRVAGPPSCASFDITSGFPEAAFSLSRMSNGNLLVICNGPDEIPAAPLPRLLSLDPATMSFSVFAFTGVEAQNDVYVLNDGVWSNLLGKAVVLDTFNDHLRAFAPGSTGNGSIFALTGSPISSPGGSSEAESMAEIGPAACDGAWVPYSVGLKGKGNFVPTLMGTGCPTPGSSLTLEIKDVVGAATGTLFVGLAPAAVPFKGGTLAVGSFVLTATIGVSGAAGVAGAGTLSLPSALPANPLLTGTSIYLQGAFNDLAAVKKVSLTQGLQMEIG